jgi:hypothetical protein
LNHDRVSRATVAVVLVDRPDEALDPALGEDERQFSIVEKILVRCRSSRAVFASRRPVVVHPAIAFAADRSRDAGEPHDPDVAEAIARVAGTEPRKRSSASSCRREVALALAEAAREQEASELVTRSSELADHGRPRGIVFRAR